MKDLAQDYNAGAVLVGTYGRTGDKVYVSTRIVNVDYNTTSAAIDFDLPVSSRVSSHLGSSATALGYRNKDQRAIWEHASK